MLKGAFIFLADLSRSIPIPHALDFVVLAGYEGALGGQTKIRLIKDLDFPNYLIKTFALRQPREIAACALLDRPYRRLVDDIPLRYVGFTVPDHFFVGYGFDLEGRFRGLPDMRIVN